jgi:hypothetical protein
VKIVSWLKHHPHDEMPRHEDLPSALMPRVCVLHGDEAIRGAISRAAGFEREAITRINDRLDHYQSIDPMH